MITKKIVDHENEILKKKKHKLLKKITEYCIFHNISLTHYTDLKLDICLTLRKSSTVLYGKKPMEMVESSQCHIKHEELINSSVFRIFKNFKSYVHFIGFEV